MSLFYLIPIVCDLLLFLTTPAFSAPDGWAATYGGDGGDWSHSIQQTRDGGYIVAGTTSSFGAGNDDAWVLKLKSDGSVEWQKTYGGKSTDVAVSIQQTVDGGYIAVAGTFSFGAGKYDIWVLKLSPEGTVEWQKTYGGYSYESAHFIQQTRDGGYIVAGETSSFGAGLTDAWVLKLKPDGAIEWQKTYGRARFDRAHSIQQTREGGYIVAGETRSFGAGEGDFWVLKLRPDGAVEWEKTYGGQKGDEAYSVQQTRDGGYIVVGYSESFPAIGKGTDLWVLKLKPDGTVEWQKTYGGILVFPSRNYSVLQASDGGYVVAGATDSFGVERDAWVLKLSTDGMVEWQKTYGRRYSHERANSVYETSDGGYIVTGDTFSFLDLDAGSELLVLKLSSDGSINCLHNLEIGDAISSEVETYAMVLETYALVRDSNVSPQDTTAITQVTNVSPQTLWP
jgi:uncharacterized delta-60 repeat protein